MAQNRTIFPSSIGQKVYRTWEFSGRLYPNGEFTFGQCFLSTKGKRTKLEQNAALESTEPLNSHNGNVLLSDLEEQTNATFNMAVQSPEPLYEPELTQEPPKRITDVTVRARRGTHGITTYAARTIRNAAYILQRDYGKNRLGMLTLTLPNLPDNLMLQVAINWANIVRKLTQKLDRLFIKKGGNFVYCGCTEIQEKRFEKYNQLAYHLHLLYVSDRTGKGDFYASSKEFSEIWKNVISNELKGFSGAKHEIDSKWKWGVDCTKIKKDAAAYLAKYMSKGAGVLTKLVADKKEHLLMSNWTHICKPLREQVRASTCPLSKEFCEFVDDNWSHLVGTPTFKWITFCPVRIYFKDTRFAEPEKQPYIELRAYCGQLTELGTKNYHDEWVATPIPTKERVLNLMMQVFGNDIQVLSTWFKATSTDFKRMVPNQPCTLMDGSKVAFVRFVGGLATVKFPDGTMDRLAPSEFDVFDSSTTIFKV